MQEEKFRHLCDQLLQQDEPRARKALGVLAICPQGFARETWEHILGEVSDTFFSLLTELTKEAKTHAKVLQPYVTPKVEADLWNFADKLEGKEQIYLCNGLAKWFRKHGQKEKLLAFLQHLPLSPKFQFVWRCALSLWKRDKSEKLLWLLLYPSLELLKKKLLLHYALDLHNLKVQLQNRLEDGAEALPPPEWIYQDWQEVEDLVHRVIFALKKGYGEVLRERYQKVRESLSPLVRYQLGLLLNVEEDPPRLSDANTLAKALSWSDWEIDTDEEERQKYPWIDLEAWRKRLLQQVDWEGVEASWQRDPEALPTLISGLAELGEWSRASQFLSSYIQRVEQLPLEEKLNALQELFWDLPSRVRHWPLENRAIFLPILVILRNVWPGKKIWKLQEGRLVSQPNLHPIPVPHEYQSRYAGFHLGHHQARLVVKFLHLALNLEDETLVEEAVESLLYLVEDSDNTIFLYTLDRVAQILYYREWKHPHTWQKLWDLAEKRLHYSHYLYKLESYTNQSVEIVERFPCSETDPSPLRRDIWNSMSRAAPLELLWEKYPEVEEWPEELRLQAKRLFAVRLSLERKQDEADKIFDEVMAVHLSEVEQVLAFWQKCKEAASRFSDDEDSEAYEREIERIEDEFHAKGQATSLSFNPVLVAHSLCEAKQYRRVLEFARAASPSLISDTALGVFGRHLLREGEAPEDILEEALLLFGEASENKLGPSVTFWANMMEAPHHRIAFVTAALTFLPYGTLRKVIPRKITVYTSAAQFYFAGINLHPSVTTEKLTFPIPWEEVREKLPLLPFELETALAVAIRYLKDMATDEEGRKHLPKMLMLLDELLPEEW